MLKRLVAPAALVVALGTIPAAQTPAEKLDLATIGQFRDEGLNRSQVMDHISWLSDVYGPRVPGSPGILLASDWALK